MSPSRGEYSSDGASRDSELGPASIIVACVRACLIGQMGCCRTLLLNANAVPVLFATVTKFVNAIKIRICDTQPSWCQVCRNSERLRFCQWLLGIEQTGWITSRF